MIFDDLSNKKKSISLIGLGYVGLPIALEFAKHFKVVGFDISEERVELMKNNIDPSKELPSEAFKNRDIEFTTKLEDLRDCAFHVVAVPTPIDKSNLPDLTPLKKATETVANILKKGDYVVFESTVFPGATEEECIPILEKVSGLKFGNDFKIGYSPERINPGDAVHTLTNVVKVVSGSDDEALEQIAKVYEKIIIAGVHRASSLKVAEAAKIIENTQRDVNISLMNELSIIFKRMNINTYEVLEAAGTKWNFLKFYPGLVGGHCIGVDPYYLTYKAAELGHVAQVINSGRAVNDHMSKFIVKELVKDLNNMGKNLSKCYVLVQGITFKEDVSDIRNSKIGDVVKELQSWGITVDVVDPHADPKEVMEEYGIELKEAVGNDYDAIISGVSHKEYLSMTEDDFLRISTPNGIIFDVKGMYRGKINKLKYLSL